MDYKVISFYKYVGINDVDTLKNIIKEYCDKFNILGRILVANEGINGAVSGKINDVENFKKFLKSNTLLKELTFREQIVEFNVYHKLVVRSRKEVVVFSKPVNLKNTGKHLAPKDFKELLDKKEDIVVLDARNNYEFSVGRFKNAVHLDINNFREFPEKVKKISNLKNKKIVMYCTGGIRCEKASAFLKENGFNDVSQLQGGIINYINEFSNDYFDGACFVFDDRLTAPSGDPVSFCSLCDTPCDDYVNCHNINCDKLFICCESCQEKMNECCSEDCKNSPNQRKEERKLDIIGKVENYYPKANVALVKLDKPVMLNSKISFCGKTTQEFAQVIGELRDYNGKIIQSADAGNIVTFPVINKVRRNDLIFIS